MASQLVAPQEGLSSVSKSVLYAHTLYVLHYITSRLVGSVLFIFVSLPVRPKYQITV
jgi:hypothetical protein